jgi:hypothetical protein
MSTQASDGSILAMSPEFPVGSVGAASSALWNFINNAAASDNSPFLSVVPFSRFAVEVTTTGDPTFSLQLVGSCALNQPSSGGSNLGSAITEAGITFVDYPGLRFLQAQLTISGGSGTVNVNIGAVAP